MSNRFKHAVIDDVTSRNIDASLQDHLLDPHNISCWVSQTVC